MSHLSYLPTCFFQPTSLHLSLQSILLASPSYPSLLPNRKITERAPEKRQTPTPSPAIPSPPRRQFPSRRQTLPRSNLFNQPHHNDARHLQVHVVCCPSIFRPLGPRLECATTGKSSKLEGTWDWAGLGGTGLDAVRRRPEGKPRVAASQSCRSIAPSTGPSAVWPTSARLVSPRLVPPRAAIRPELEKKKTRDSSSSVSSVLRPPFVTLTLLFSSITGPTPPKRSTLPAPSTSGQSRRSSRRSATSSRRLFVCPTPRKRSTTRWVRSAKKKHRGESFFSHRAVPLLLFSSSPPVSTGQETGLKDHSTASPSPTSTPTPTPTSTGLRTGQRLQPATPELGWVPRERELRPIG